MERKNRIVNFPSKLNYRAFLLKCGRAKLKSKPHQITHKFIHCWYNLRAEFIRAMAVILFLILVQSDGIILVFGHNKQPFLSHIFIHMLYSVPFSHLHCFTIITYLSSLFSFSILKIVSISPFFMFVCSFHFKYLTIRLKPKKIKV